MSVTSRPKAAAQAYRLAIPLFTPRWIESKSTMRLAAAKPTAKTPMKMPSGMPKTVMLDRSPKLGSAPDQTRTRVNLVLVWSGALPSFGLRSSITVFGIPLGIFIGVFAVGLAAASLIVDFDSIQRGVNKGIAKRYAWAAAFGLLVTLIWLYIEFLRILALSRGR